MEALAKAPSAVAPGPDVPALAFWPTAVELALPPTNDWKPTAVSPLKLTDALAPMTTALVWPLSVAFGPMTTESVPEKALTPMAMALAPVDCALVPMAMVLALFATALSPTAIDEIPFAALFTP